MPKPQGMAGNIIHAIATTNAIVGGLIVTEALKLLAGAKATPARRSTYLLQHLSNKKLLMPTEAPPPAPGCFVCGKAQAGLTLDTQGWTLQQLVDKVHACMRGVGVRMRAFLCVHRRRHQIQRRQTLCPGANKANQRPSRRRHPLPAGD